MKTYAVTVKQNSDAFAAIRRFDPEAVIEFENGCVDLEYYTITSEYDLHHLLDAETAIQDWDVAEADSYNADFPAEDAPPHHPPINLVGAKVIFPTEAAARAAYPGAFPEAIRGGEFAVGRSSIREVGRLDNREIFRAHTWNSLNDSQHTYAFFFRP